MQINTRQIYSLAVKSAIPFFMGFAFFYLNTVCAFSQANLNPPPKSALRDSTKALMQDSAKVKQDSAKTPIDTVKIYPSKMHGSQLSVDNAQVIISKKDYQFDPYSSFCDILEKRTHSARFSLGAVGFCEGISINGSNPASQSTAFNSRALFDPNFGSYDFNYVAMDFLETAQLFYGSDAAILSDNSSGFFTNIQEQEYNSARPFSKIYFAQGGNGYLASEGTFSQNLRKDLNFSFGFRRQSADGRFDNQKLDAWNVRGLLRYNPNDFESLSLTENFYNYKRGDNGGVAWDSSTYYDELSAAVQNDSLYSRNYRHDLTLSYSNIFDSTQINSVALNAYYTNSIWQRREYSNSLRTGSNSLIKSYESSFWGLNGAYKTSVLNPITLNVGANLDDITIAAMNGYERKSGVKYSAFGQAKINFWENLSLKGGIRITNFKDINLFNIGAGLNYQPNKSSEIVVDLSRFDNFPLYLSTNDFSIEHHNLLLFSSKFKVNRATYELGGYLRYIQNEIVATSIMDSSNTLVTGIKRFALDNSNYYGIYLSAENSLIDSALALNSKLLFDNGTSDYRRAPLATLKLNPEYSIKVGRSILHAGLNILLLYDAPIIGYFSDERAYYWTSGVEPRIDKFSNRIDIYAVAKLGNAYVRAELYNLLSSSYYTTAVYPEATRELRISVSWSFFD